MNEKEILEQSQELSRAIMERIVAWLEFHGRKPNAYIINEAMAPIWYAFCGQLDEEKRAILLRRFLASATMKVHGIDK